MSQFKDPSLHVVEDAAVKGATFVCDYCGYSRQYDAKWKAEAAARNHQHILVNEMSS